LGLAILVGGLVIGFFYAWRIRTSIVSAVGDSRSVAVVILVLLGMTVGAAPFLGWRIVEDVRYTSEIDPWLAPRYGVSVFRVHPEIFDNAALRIPPTDTYYLESAGNLDRVTKAAFREWALGYLLPRTAVADPDQAEWILTLGVDPSSVGPRVSQTWTMKASVNGLPPAFLGKVAR
jgi:hypothetical protein